MNLNLFSAGPRWAAACLRRPAMSRRWSCSIGLALFSAAVVVAITRPPAARRFCLAGLGRIYAAIDPWSQRVSPGFGPGPSLVTQSGHADRMELERGLQQWFPEQSWSVRQFPGSHAAPVEGCFAHENLSHAEVDRLVKVVDSMVPHSTSLLDACDRIRGLTRHDNSDVAEVPDNPLELLKLIQRGIPMTCRPFAVAFLGYCTARGFTSRLVGLSKDGVTMGHAVVEVYVPEFGKWLVIDPDFNLVYRRNGKLLDAWELHEAWTQIKTELCRPDDSPDEIVRKVAAHRGEISSMTGVELVCLGERACRDLWETSLKFDSFSQTNLEYFEMVLYNTRNDYLSATYPIGHPVRVRQMVLNSDDSSRFLAACPEAQRATSRDELYWTVGWTTARVVKRLEGSPACTVLVEFATWTPNFLAFELRVDGMDWQPLSGRSYEWTLHSGSNNLEVRSVNLGRLRGETAVIELVCNPQQASAVPGERLRAGTY